MTDKITPKQQEILDKIVLRMVDVLDVNPDDVTMDANVAYDLGLDSVDIIELMDDIEKNFHLSILDDQQERIQTVGDIVRVIERTSTKFNKTVAPKNQTKSKSDVQVTVTNVTKVADKTETPKVPNAPKNQTKSKSDVQITITNVPKGNEKPTTLNCGTITDAQKQEFLAAISEHKPSVTDDDFYPCGFILYYAQSSKGVHVHPYGMPEEFRLSKRKIGENELVVEMLPLSKEKCGSWENYNCPKYIASGKCRSPFIKKYIGEVLFPDKYGKQR